MASLHVSAALLMLDEPVYWLVPVACGMWRITHTYSSTVPVELDKPWRDNVLGREHAEPSQ